MEHAQTKLGIDTQAALLSSVSAFFGRDDDDYDSGEEDSARSREWNWEPEDDDRDSEDDA